MIIMIRALEGDAAQNAMKMLQREVDRRYEMPVRSVKNIPVDATALFAYRGDQVVSCCSVQLQRCNSSVGIIGHFDSLDDTAASSALLTSAVKLLREQGAARVIGPMNGDTWHSYRFVTSSFEIPPFLKEPCNPPFYPSLWEAAGFSVVETYDTFVIREVERAASSLKPFYKRTKRNGYSFEPLTRKNYISMLPVIYDLSCRIFDGNILYTPIDFDKFSQMYRPAIAILRDGLSWIATNAQGHPAGFIFVYPDYFEAVQSMRGGSGLFSKINFLLNRRKACRTCIKSLGVIPSSRRSGLSSALMHLALDNSCALGYQESLMCLMHSSNDSRRMGASYECPYRTYALYEDLS